MDRLSLSAIPSGLWWANSPLRWSADDNKSLTIVAGPICDLFTDPGGASGAVTMNSSPRLLFHPPAGDFILSARVTVEFWSKYDAGVLVLYANDKRWAKLCFEFSPQRQAMVVSVVNRDVSDDCNSTIVDGNQTYLRIARIGGAYAFHASADGKWWNFVRYFTFDRADNLAAGFSAQSPTGEGCSVKFDEIHYEARTVGNLRSGE